jgi:hypothetical protein
MTYLDFESQETIEAFAAASRFGNALIQRGGGAATSAAARQQTAPQRFRDAMRQRLRGAALQRGSASTIHGCSDATISGSWTQRCNHPVALRRQSAGSSGWTGQKLQPRPGLGRATLTTVEKMRMERSQAADQTSFRKSTMLCEAMMISAR